MGRLTTTFPKSKRLCAAGAVKRVFDGSCASSKSQGFTILATPNEMPTTRVAVMVAKRFIRTAVARNRVKRVVRESFRRECELEGFDIVVMVRSNLTDVPNKVLFECLTKQWKELSKRCKKS